MNTGQPNPVTIDKVLVVIDPDELAVKPSVPSLIERAEAVARSTDATLELFSACHDPSLELKLFATREEVSEEKERIANQVATGVAELALDLQSRNFDVAHEVRWDHPPADAILRKIADSGADLVMTNTRSPNYFFGLSQNTDWELIRNAPVHIWFVKEREQADGPVLTAIGSNAADSDIIGDLDHLVFRMGTLAANCLETRNLPVHCFQVPNVHAYATYAPSMAGAMTAAMQPNAWQDLAQLHGEAIDRFAEHFGIDPTEITLLKGEPARELPSQAMAVNAGLLVMGARNLGRWERALNPVAAEPVLAEAPCDLLFVKESSEFSTPRSASPPPKVNPEVDLEMAIVYPEKAFKTPLAIAHADQLSRELRSRLLEIWEVDAKAQLRAENEGGPVHSTQAGVLKEIQSARRELAAMQERKAG